MQLSKQGPSRAWMTGKAIKRYTCGQHKKATRYKYYINIKTEECNVNEKCRRKIVH